jgi:hypothetical protein
MEPTPQKHSRSYWPLLTLALVLLCAGTYAVVLLILFAPHSPDPIGSAEPSQARQHAETILMKRISSSSDLFGLYALHETYSMGPKADTEILEKIEARMHMLAEECAKPLCKGTDIVAFEYARVAEGKYRFACLLRNDRKWQRDYRFYIQAHVSPGQIEALEEADRSRRFADWSFRPGRPTMQWPVPGFVRIEHEVDAKPIPYMLRFGFVNPNGKTLGLGLRFGWVADPRD